MKNIDFEVPLVEGDNGPLIEFLIVDEENEPVDLSGKTVGFVFKRAGEFEAVNGAASGCSALEETGKAVYAFGANDLSKPGTYFGDLVVSASGVSETASDAVRFVVRPSNK